MKSLLTVIAICFFNLSTVQAQCSRNFFEREPFPFPTKSCSVYQTIAKTNKEELVLTVTLDSVNNVLKYEYLREFYFYSGSYYDEGFGLVWLNNRDLPIKKIYIHRYMDYNNAYTYIYSYDTYKYNASGKLISYIEPELTERPNAKHFSEEFILHSFEKELTDSTANQCRSDYVYNSLGLVESVMYYSMNGDTVISKWMYDHKKRLVKKEFFKDGQLIEEITSVYKEGYIFSEYFIYNYEERVPKRENQKILLKVKFENNKLVYQAFSSDGIVRNETIYKYNSAGDLVECIYYGEQKVLDRVMKYKY